jgi:negative modulator of initiation of replication
MKTIQIDEDLYLSLEKEARFGEMPNDVVRRLIKPVPIPAPPRNNESALLRLIADRKFVLLNATEKSLRLLSTACHEKGENEFVKLLDIGGRKRKYFGRSAEDIESSGTSTHPRPIPETTFWMMTNADTEQKKLILAQALNILGYPSDVIQTVTNAIF